MILKADRARLGALCESSAAGKVVGVHVHAVEPDDDLVIAVDDEHLVPLASRLGGGPMSWEPGDDSASVMVGKLRRGLFTGRVVDLHFDALFDGIFHVPDTEVEAAVATLLELVFEFDLEFGVLFLRPEVSGEARPTLFAWAGRERGDPVLQRPVAGGGPVVVETLGLR